MPAAGTIDGMGDKPPARHRTGRLSGSSAEIRRILRWACLIAMAWGPFHLIADPLLERLGRPAKEHGQGWWLAAATMFVGGALGMLLLRRRRRRES